MAEYKPIEEDELVAMARGRSEATAEQLGDMAAEILRHRKADRVDSRLAQQVKKMRWAVENLLKKTEDLERGEDLEGLIRNEPPWLEDAAKALGEVGPDGRPLAIGWQAVIRRIESLRLRHDALRKIATTYAQHLANCNTKGRCSCGFTDAIAAALTAGDGHGKDGAR